VLPLTLIRKEIKNKTVRSFLYYVPYAVLAVMTIPAIFLSSKYSLIAGICGFTVALILSYFKKGLLPVAASACATVLVVELLLKVIPM
jgi:branched-subunit amino acid transport protein